MGKLRLAGGVRYEKVTLKAPDFTTLAFYGSRQVDGGEAGNFHKALFNGGVIVEPVEGLRAYASYAEGYTIADVGRILRGNQHRWGRRRQFPVARAGGFQQSRARDLNGSAAGSPPARPTGGRRPSSDRCWCAIRMASSTWFGQPIEIEGLDLAVDARNADRRAEAGSRLCAHPWRDRRRTATAKWISISTEPTSRPTASTSMPPLPAVPFDARLAARFYLEREFDGQPEANRFRRLYAGRCRGGVPVRPPSRLVSASMNLLDKHYISYFSDTRAPTGSITSDTTYFAGSRPDFHPRPDERVLG